MKNFILLITILSLTSGCASMKKSLITGGAIGMTTGAAIGNSQGRGAARNKATNNGALIGAILGLGIGYLGYRSEEKKISAQIGKKDPKKDVPLLTQPKVKRVWVKDKIQGKRFIKGHWEYIIKEQSVWSR